MRIDRALNFVIPVDRLDGSTVYVHAAPIGTQVFDKYFLPIAKTFAAIYSEGLGSIAGPRVAHKLLQRISESMKIWDGPDGVQNGLVSEMHRLTNVLAPGKNGWDPVPYEEALARGIIDGMDAPEIEGALTYFTVASHMYRKRELEDMLRGAGELWGARIEFLDCTALMRSLPTSMPDGSSGAKPA